MAETDQAKVTLHWLNASRSQRILWLLTELDVPYDLKFYHRDPKTGLAGADLEKVHPLGKSPVITVTPPAANAGGADAKPIVLAESGFIVEYLCEHWGHGTDIVPAKWREGREHQVGGETAAWLRYQYLMHYAEGSLMPFLVVYFVFSTLKSSAVPWFLRPITSSIANKVSEAYVLPNVHRHLKLLESYLAEPPAASDGTGYLCGGHLTAADILLSFPLLSVRERREDLGPWEGGSMDTAYPKLFAYLDRLEKEPSYQKAVAKIVEVEGSYSVLM
ncbi:glutathione s-transferase [Niveomyces insectorum RCEF 264]|uniref:glutathione transferase n=1 Tax=Niveomyces insectorum RCEF 264 TaxID=1081102 RepID=A0A168A1T5_9HYPO|nr:glutathione s-transferase [Niveomyces insectorum RCEF 264]